MRGAVSTYRAITEISASAAIATLAAAGAHAQATPEATATLAAPDHGSLGEIVVTAQRRSENLQRVPVAVAVASSKQLESVGAIGAQDLKLVVPGVNVLNTGNYISPLIRGVGSRSFGAGVENPNALYVDDVYYASQVAGILSFNNISQVEVLKGPQGTLFGRNATGGLMQVRTRDPGDDLSVNARLGYASYESFPSNLYVSGPITSGVRADLALQGSWQSEGWRNAKNIVNGDDVYRTNHDIGARSKILFDLGESTTLRLIGDDANVATSKGVYQIIPDVGVAPPFFAAPNLSPYDAALNVNPVYRVRDGGVSAKLTHDFGGVSATSIPPIGSPTTGLRWTPT